MIVVIRDYKWTSRSIIGVARYVFYRYISKLMNFWTKIKQEMNLIIYRVITICNEIFVILHDLYTGVYKSIPWVIISKEKKYMATRPLSKKTKDFKINKQMFSETGKDVHLFLVASYWVLCENDLLFLHFVYYLKYQRHCCLWFKILKNSRPCILLTVTLIKS